MQNVCIYLRVLPLFLLKDQLSGPSPDDLPPRLLLLPLPLAQVKLELSGGPGAVLAGHHHVHQLVDLSSQVPNPPFGRPNHPPSSSGGAGPKVKETGGHKNPVNRRAPEKEGSRKPESARGTKTQGTELNRPRPQGGTEQTTYFEI